MGIDYLAQYRGITSSLIGLSLLQAFVACGQSELRIAEPIREAIVIGQPVEEEEEINDRTP